MESGERRSRKLREQETLRILKTMTPAERAAFVFGALEQSVLDTAAQAYNDVPSTIWLKFGLGDQDWKAGVDASIKAYANTLRGCEVDEGVVADLAGGTEKILKDRGV